MLRVIGVLIVSYLLFELGRLSGIKTILNDIALGRIKIDDKTKMITLDNGEKWVKNDDQ